jgi:hypothetical protein
MVLSELRRYVPAQRSRPGAEVAALATRPLAEPEADMRRARTAARLRRDNRRVDAREHLRAAHDMLAVTGANAFAERARRQLVTGERVRKRRGDTRDELSRQEEPQRRGLPRSRRSSVPGARRSPAVWRDGLVEGGPGGSWAAQRGSGDGTQGARGGRLPRCDTGAHRAITLQLLRPYEWR